MNGPRRVEPGDLAIIDQHAALLRELVDTTRRHMRTCPTKPAGVCLGEATTQAIVQMSCADLGNLLQEAVAQLARAEPPPGAPNGPVV